LNEPLPVVASAPTPVPGVRRPAADTISNSGFDGDTWSGSKSPPIPADALPGYRFLKCVGNSPLMDQWKVQAPDGARRLLKLVYGYGLRDKRLDDAILRLRSLQHPALAPMDVVHVQPGRLVLVADMATENLRDRAAECQSRKLPGILRGELLDYMRTAAEALDYLYQQHSIQHLGLNPRNLVFGADGRLQITDFGLAQLLWLPAGQALAQRNARYAAPELFDRHPSRGCDQYSLALIYAALLTGAHPLASPNKGMRRKRPKLDSLSHLDLPGIAPPPGPDPRNRRP